MIRAAFVALLLALAVAAPAAAETGETGPVTVTVDPTTGLADGDTVTITAAATGVELYEIRAHVCVGDARVSNTFDFSFDGAYCSQTPVSPNSDAEKAVVIEPGTGASGELTFRVGTGTGQPWTDFVNGQTHQLTCSETDLCDLVVQLQITDDTVFFTAPLAFGNAPARQRLPALAPGETSTAGTAPVVAGSGVTTTTASLGGDEVALVTEAPAARRGGGTNDAPRWIGITAAVMAAALALIWIRQRRMS